MPSGISRLVTGAPATSNRSTGSRGARVDLTGPGRGGGLGRRRVHGSRGGTHVIREHVAFEVLHELAHQLRRHVGEHPAPELRDLAGDRQVGVHVDARATTVFGHRHDDLRLGVALPARVAPGRVQHDAAGRFVDLGQLGRALVLRGDRPDLDLHDAAVVVAFDLLQFGARQAGRDALDVEQHLPGLVERTVHSEVVADFHPASNAARSSGVSMSVGEPVPSHGTSVGP